MFEKKYFKFLACPYCRINLKKRGENKLVCPKCNREFSIKKGVPIIIPDNFNTQNWEKGKRELKANGFLKSLFTNKKKTFLNAKDKVTLDIGCGENAEGKINMDVYFPEKIPSNFLIGSGESLPFLDNSIDIVKSSYVIEHMINPANFILECARVAKEKVIIITDNSDWIGEIFMRLIGVGRIFHDEHYYKWSEEYMRNLIKRLELNSEVQVLNLSPSFFVKFLSMFGFLPRIGPLFYRDLYTEIIKQKQNG